MRYFLALLLSCGLAACAPDTSVTDESAAPGESATEATYSTSESGVRIKEVPGFGGVIAESYEDSEEWWPPEQRPNEGAPNVIIFLLDDGPVLHSSKVLPVRPDVYWRSWLHHYHCRKK